MFAKFILQSIRQNNELLIMREKANPLRPRQELCAKVSKCLSSFLPPAQVPFELFPFEYSYSDVDETPNESSDVAVPHVLPYICISARLSSMLCCDKMIYILTEGDSEEQVDPTLVEKVTSTFVTIPPRAG